MHTQSEQFQFQLQSTAFTNEVYSRVFPFIFHLFTEENKVTTQFSVCFSFDRLFFLSILIIVVLPQLHYDQPFAHTHTHYFVLVVWKKHFIGCAVVVVFSSFSSTIFFVRFLNIRLWHVFHSQTEPLHYLTGYLFNRSPSSSLYMSLVCSSINCFCYCFHTVSLFIPMFCCIVISTLFPNIRPKINV